MPAAPEFSKSTSNSTDGIDDIKKLIANFEASVCRILGRQEFQKVGQFFLSLLEKCREYEESGKPYLLAFLTRRCHVLFQIYLEYFQALQSLQAQGIVSDLFPEIYAFSPKWLDRVVSKCITDVNLLSLAPSLKEYYDKCGDFPRIVIADELLIHGRAINGFLRDLEKCILGLFSSDEDKAEALEKLGDKLSLRVYAKSTVPLLLLGRYIQRLDDSSGFSRESSWRSLSARFARLIMAASVNNISYSWGLRIPLFSEDSDPYGRFKETCGVFEHYKTNLQETEEDNFIFLYPNDSEVKAFCTVRTKKSLMPLLAGQGGSAPASRIFAPYLMFDHLPRENLLALHDRILADLEDSGEAFMPVKKCLERSGMYDYGQTAVFDDYYRWIAETNELVLEYLLFRKFVEDVIDFDGLTAGDLKEYVDFGPILRNYKWIKAVSPNGSNSGIQWEILDPPLECLWDWSPRSDLLERYLDILLDGVSPIWREGQSRQIHNKAVSNRMISNDDPIALAVQNAVADIGYWAEENAHARYTSGVSFSERALARWGDYYSIGDILAQCDRSLQEISEYYDVQPPEANLCQVISVLVQSMDIGLIGMSPLYGERSYGGSAEDELYTMVKAGEQSLFIMPNRYREFIPVLLRIQERWHDKKNVERDIGLFAQAYCGTYPELREQPEKLKKRLLKFLDRLESSGQALDEWNILLSDFPGIDYVSSQGKPQKAASRFLEDWKRQSKCLNVYRQI